MVNSFQAFWMKINLIVNLSDFIVKKFRVSNKNYYIIYINIINYFSRFKEKLKESSGK